MNIIEAYIEHGFALVPIPAGSKGPNLKGWNERENAITDLSNIKHIKGNVGLAHAYCLHGPTAAFDIDSLEKARSFLLNHNINLDDLLNAKDAVQISSGRVNRAKLLYRLPPDSALMVTHQATDPEDHSMIFELRCVSQNGKTMQDVLPPSIHPETGHPYQWAGAGSWQHIPIIPDALLSLWHLLGARKNPFVQNAPIVEQTTPSILSPADLKNLRSALFHIRADDRAIWVKCGLALKKLGKGGRDTWLEWSATSDKFDLHTASKTWDSFVPESIDYRFVFAEAQRLGWLNPAKSIPTPQLSDQVHLDLLNNISLSMPQKLPGQLLPVMKLNPNHLPKSISEGVVDIAERLSCEIDYVAVAVLAGAGTVLGNRIGILPKEFDESWVVHSGFWGGIVGSPGSKKTTALTAALKPIHHLEEQAAIQYKHDYAQYKKDKAAFDSAMKKPNGEMPAEPVEPVKKRYLVNDVTYQALGEILSNNPQGILALSDELSGLLQSLDSPGQEAARGFFLSGWGGNGSYTFDRIARGSITLNRYLLAVFGGFQPDRIKSYVHSAQSGSSKNDGLLQRFQLLVWPDQNDSIDLVDRPANKLALEKMYAAVTKLKDINSSYFSEAIVDQRGVVLLHFSPEAQTLFNKWFIQNEAMLRKTSLTSSENSHFSKYRSLIPGLALLYHSLDSHSGAVCLECLESSLRFAVYLKSHAKRIYASVHGHDAAPARSLASKLIVGAMEDGFTKRSLIHKGWANLSQDWQAKLALDSLVELGWLTEMIPENVGRKTTRYWMRPGISETLL